MDSKDKLTLFTLESKYRIYNYPLWLSFVIVGLALMLATDHMAGITAHPWDQRWEILSVFCTVFAGLSVGLCTHFQVFTFTPSGIQLQFRRTLYSIRRRTRTYQIQWSDIIAWRDIFHDVGIYGTNRRSIDLVVHLNGENKLFKTGIEVDAKHVRFNEEQIDFAAYKAKLLPFIKDKPQSHYLFDDNYRWIEKKAAAYLFAGWTLTLVVPIVAFASLALNHFNPGIFLGFIFSGYFLRAGMNLKKELKTHQ